MPDPLNPFAFMPEASITLEPGAASPYDADSRLPQRCTRRWWLRA
jgi:hypothetical protein